MPAAANTNNSGHKPPSRWLQRVGSSERRASAVMAVVEKKLVLHTDSCRLLQSVPVQKQTNRNVFWNESRNTCESKG